MSGAIGILLALALFAWIAAGQAWTEVASLFQQLTWPVLLSTVLALFASYGVRAARVFDEFSRSHEIGFRDCLRIILIHNVAVNVLPFRSGELAFPILLARNTGVTLARGVASLAWFRMQDLVVLAALALVVFPNLPWWGRALGLAALLALSLLMPVWVRRSAHWRPSKGPLTVLSTFRDRLNEATLQSRNGWFWTVANWALKLFALAWLLSHVLSAQWTTGFAAAIGGEASALLPVQGAAGFGTYEAGAAALLLPSGIPFETGLRAALVTHTVVLLASLLGGAIGAFIPASNRSAVPLPQRVPR